MMAEASSSPPPSSFVRTPVKLLEYTTCSDTNVPSTPAKPTGETHSSFDSISQPRDVQNLINLPTEIDYQRKHPPLERDLRRVDIDSTTYNLAMNHKPLDRKEAISLPCTSVDSISSMFNTTCSQLISTQPNERADDEQDDDDNYDDDDHDTCHSSVRKSTTGETISNSESVTQSNSSSPSSETNIPNSHGVDWTENASPISHCWFSYTPNDPSSCQPCSFYSCKNPKPSLFLSLLQCESCLIVVHTHHLTDLQMATIPISQSMPSCRPSFIESNESNEEQNFDQHFLINIPYLTKPCVLCKRKSMSNSFFGSNRTSTTPILDLTNPKSNHRSSIPCSGKALTSSNTIQCLWCLRSFHRRCWEHNYRQDEKNRCDYGVFRNIIVRPQWIHRDPNNRIGFRAEYPVDTDYHSDFSPLLLFINKRSGGQSGEKIYRKLLHLLNPRQVFLLENDQTIVNALEIYASLENTRICVFGGDGTVGWVLGRLAESYPSLNNPPVCICPLGTGNDLSRVLSWGDQYDPKRLLSMLTLIPYAQVIALDRWQVTTEPLEAKSPDATSNGGRSIFSTVTHPKFIRDTTRSSYQNHRTLPNTRFINYMSFGLDAAIALEFHDRRSRDPSKFSSPLKNKLMYLNESRKYLNDFARSRMWNLSSYIRLICDGENFTHLIQNCHTLLVLNIPGYASGTNPWGKTSSSTSSQQNNIQKDSDSFEQISTSSIDLTDYPANTHEVYELVTLNECSNDMTKATTTAQTGRFERQDFGDKKIEVVGLSTTHMATIHIGFRGIRIAQCNQLRIEMCCPMTAQMDGEPFYLPESVAVNITHAGQVLVLRNENR